MNMTWNVGCRILPRLLIAALLFAPALGQLQPLEEDQGVTGLGLALRKLGVTGSVLYITAHPDDENNGVLVKLSRGMGLRTGLLTLTRGDGGQNVIGTELFEAIGVLRSEELLAVHRYDGAEQFFTRAYEFGYSFSVEETFQKWGRQEILGDVVRVIRHFRPQVILSMSPSGEGGGQHHQASAQLAAEAFGAAADPTRFPEQISQQGLQAWKTLRLFQSARFRRSRTPPEGQDFYIIQVGDYDLLLGETFAEFGIRSRTQHRCQGMGRLTRPGPARSYYLLADSTVDSPTQGTDLMTGLEVGLSRAVGFDSRLEPLLGRLGQKVDQAKAAYQRSEYKKATRSVMEGLALVRQALQATHQAEARHLLVQEEKDFLQAAARGHFLHFDAFATGGGDGTVIPGQSFPVEVSFYDRSSELTNPRIELLAPSGWTVEQTALKDNTASYTITASARAELSQTYWYRFDPGVDRFAVKEGFTGMEPFAPPPLKARLHYLSNRVPAWAETSVQHRWWDSDAARERRMEVKVVPELSVSLSPRTGVLSTRNPGAKTLKATVHSNIPKGTQARLRLEVPEGWQVSPPWRELQFQYENQRVTAAFEVRPPAHVESGDYEIQAIAEIGEKSFTQGYQVIAYHHIQTRHLYHPATSTIRAFDFQLPEALLVGYVTGVGDEVGQATEELGARVVYLEEEDLASGDLSRFDAIVIGVRAYLNRQDLIAHNQRLIDYVEGGGHLIGQWNKYEFNRAQYTPYPAKITRPPGRISVEEAPVRLLQPEHPVFHFPNRITPSDWEGWIQERSTYMLGEWDERYTPLIEMEDPWPYNAGSKLGGLLFTRYGKGTYLSAGLAFFRQLPGGVPGAYRLWANILSLGRADEAQAKPEG